MKKVLIIEDEEALSNMYRIAFELDGFEVAIAENGLDALVKMTKFAPSLILLDIMMPKFNGFEFLLKLKELNKKKSFKIIVNSNLEQRNAERKATALGADFYLRKSCYTAVEIVKKISQIT